ncbi:hypothetical protein A3Q56_06907, partial [Intoshia linei]
MYDIEQDKIYYKNHIESPKRLFLYESLNLDSFRENRKFAFDRTKSFKQKFIDIISQNIKNEDYIVYEADIKTFIHLLENQNDVNILILIMDRYLRQVNNMYQFNFGPIIMRSLHHINLPNEAIEIYKKLTRVFDNFASLMIFFDLLYKNKQFDDMLNLFLYKDINKNSSRLISAICGSNLEQNLSKNTETMIDVIFSSNFQYIPRRAIIFLFKFALNHQNFNLMQRLSTYDNPRIMKQDQVVNFKILTILEIEPVEKVFIYIQNIIDNLDQYDIGTIQVYSDVMQHLQIKSYLDGKESTEKLEKIKPYITCLPETFGQILTTPIEYIREKRIKTNQNQNKSLVDILNNLQKNENHVPGFCFENVSRNETFKEAKLKSVKTGTTIVGIIFKGGIILGADTRATNGPIVADKNCEKIHYISDYIYCCGAGTAADAEMTTELISSKMQLMQLTWKKKPYVSAACRQIRQELFKHMGYISAAFILGGVDNKGSHLYRISPHGSVCNMQFAAMG